MKRLTFAVTCSECGKTLRGHEGVLNSVHVAKHKTPDGKPCWGARRTNHKRVEKP